MRRKTALVPAFLLLAVAAGCSRGRDEEPPVATPSIALSRDDAAIGSPIDIIYRFDVAAGAPAFAEDYWVFVHFLDTDGELMWTDDHAPATPTREWKAGSTVAYTRTMFIPKFPYVGETRIEVGLFSPRTGERLRLAGETEGQREYRVGAFNLRLQTDNLFVVFRDGWHETEVGNEGTGLEWQWSQQEATLSFRNPRRDVLFYLQVDQPAAALQPQRVEVRLGQDVVDTFLLPSGVRELRRVMIAADRFGAADTVDMTVSVDQTFVPALVPALRSADSRELGIRVFRAFVQPL